MNIRKPTVAGRFYPDSPSEISAALDEYLSGDIDANGLPATIVGGLVPHAGWVCSGAVAAKVFKAIAARATDVQTFVLLGAVHRLGVYSAAVFSAGAWKTPLGQIEVDEKLASQILIESNLLKTHNAVHQLEHSIEVQLPFIQRLFPKARILPIMVPPSQCAPETGAVVARAIRSSGTRAVCVGSTDLTHYGPSYNFTPQGTGPEALRWAKDVNDRGLLDRIEKMDPAAAYDYAETARAACGAGAVAAAVAAAAELGADTAKILDHTTSFEVLSKQFGDRGPDFVGYAGIVFGKK